LTLRTDDGGRTWKDQESGVALNLYAVALAGPNDALAVGDQGRVLQTQNGGERWDMLSSATSVPLYAVAYRGGSAAWVAGRGGAILRRTDDVNTINLPRPKLPPALQRRAKPKLQTSDAPPKLNDGDLPRAAPPNKKSGQPKP